MGMDVPSLSFRLGTSLFKVAMFLLAVPVERCWAVALGIKLGIVILVVVNSCPEWLMQIMYTIIPYESVFEDKIHTLPWASAG